LLSSDTANLIYTSGASKKKTFIQAANGTIKKICRVLASRLFIHHRIIYESKKLNSRIKSYPTELVNMNDELIELSLDSKFTGLKRRSLYVERPTPELVAKIV
jgi:hypothetical protein